MVRPLSRWNVILWHRYCDRVQRPLTCTTYSSGASSRQRMPPALLCCSRPQLASPSSSSGTGIPSFCMQLPFRVPSAKRSTHACTAQPTPKATATRRRRGSSDVTVRRIAAAPRTSGSAGNEVGFPSVRRRAASWSCQASGASAAAARQVRSSAETASGGEARITASAASGESRRDNMGASSMVCRASIHRHRMAGLDTSTRTRSVVTKASE
mmetsp:Transcript_43335/g.112292  ORF Transcript_43335/g.112292 Transcript_43335/m.112292 type:complete len:212 (+) Transcript_43335:326-961(+)